MLTIHDRYAIISAGVAHKRQNVCKDMAVQSFPRKGVSCMSTLEILTLINTIIAIVNLAIVNNNKKK
jgi:hypothetical protein